MRGDPYLAKASRMPHPTTNTQAKRHKLTLKFTFFTVKNPPQKNLTRRRKVLQKTFAISGRIWYDNLTTQLNIFKQAYFSVKTYA